MITERAESSVCHGLVSHAYRMLILGPLDAQCCGYRKRDCNCRLKTVKGKYCLIVSRSYSRNVITCTMS